MKVGKNKLLQKILMVTLTTLILFNFIMPTVVRADEDEEVDEEVSSLAGPIQSLVVLIGDAGMSLMQYVFVGNWDVTKKVRPDFEWDEINWYESFGGYLYREFDKFLTTYIDIPNFQISPESIFQGDIPAFDINFFNPGKNIEEEQYIYLDTVQNFLKALMNKQISFESENGEAYKNKVEELVQKWEMEFNTAYEYFTDEQKNEAFEIIMSEPSDEIATFLYERMSTYNPAYGDFTSSTSFANIPLENSIVRESSASILQSTVSYWYNQLRNIAIIGLLSVLVYVGIRIVLSSAASDKSKYKEMLKDWAVAMCLLFFMHYFMNFVVTITESISKTLQPSTLQSSELQFEIDGETYTTDVLVGDVRLRLQTEEKLAARWSYTIIYLVIVIYTIIFAIMYLKRVIYMAFFTMMAPLVALTYPLDKARDGKAQAFDIWMKEYTFNALIQPFHLIIYYVLVSSAIDLVVNNPLYALVAIGFMMPAEKLLRKFFGFNKSETSGVLGGALGGAMIMQGINALSKRAGSSGGKKAGGQESKEKANKAVRTADSGNNMNSIMDDLGTNTANNPENPENPENPILNRNLNNQETQNDEERESLEQWNSFYEGMGDEPLYSPNERTMSMEEVPEQEENDEVQNVNQVDLPENVEEDEIPTIRAYDAENNDKEETHRFRAGVSMAGRWALKGAGLAAKGVGAVTLGTVGIAAGLASDDYSNVLKYGAAGAAAGGLTVGAVMNKVPSTAYRIKENVRREREEFEKDSYSAAERKRRANSRADKEFLKDEANIRLYKDKFGKDDYAQAMEDAIKYREYGITDNDTIIKAMKLKTKGLGDRADKRRILIAGTAPSLGRKDVDNYGERLEKRGFGKQAEVMKKAVREFNDFE